MLLALLAPIALDVHVGGGIEEVPYAAPHPDGVGELGVGLQVLVPGHAWGFALIADSIGRMTDPKPVASERKLDLALIFANAKRDMRFHVGMGVRRLTVVEPDAPTSTVDGFDLLRLGWDYQLARSGSVGLAFYMSWTVGVYKGEVTTARFGDMAYPTEELSAGTISLIAGLKSTFSVD